MTETKHLNGPSGDWVAKKLLAPLTTDRQNAWIADCLDTYRASGGARRAIRPVRREDGPFAALLVDASHLSETRFYRHTSNVSPSC